jgi:hypothetical protein
MKREARNRVTEIVRKKISKFASTFAALLSATDLTVDVSAQLEDIRHAMLESLSVIPAGTPGLDKTWGAIARAGAAQTLWYLRSDLMALLAEQRGEMVARKNLEHITQLFQGLVPSSLLGASRKPKK